MGVVCKTAVLGCTQEIQDMPRPKKGNGSSHIYFHIRVTQVTFLAVGTKEVLKGKEKERFPIQG